MSKIQRQMMAGLMSEYTTVGKLQFAYRFLKLNGHRLDFSLKRELLHGISMIDHTPGKSPIIQGLLDEIFHITDTWMDDWMRILTSDDSFRYSGHDPHLTSCAVILA